MASPVVASRLYLRVMTTDAVATLVVSAAAVALTVTVPPAGSAFGALNSPACEIVPTEPFPPTMPLTFQTTEVFVEPVTVAVNCLVAFTFTVALAGETLIVTCAGCTIATDTVFETSPSGVLTTTGADGFAVAAVPVPLNRLPDTNVVGSVVPSNEITEPLTKPAPFTVSVNGPVGTGDGETDVIDGAGMMVTEEAPLDVGALALVARTVTTSGLGTAVGGM